MRYATRVEGLGGAEAAAWDIHAAALERRARGQDVILLSVGDPDFPTPAPIVEAAKASLERGRTRYAEVAGAAALRAAIAAHHERLTGQRVTPGQVAVLAGAQSALFAACQCLLDPSDAVLVPEPMYVTYPATVAAAGGRLVRVPLVPERGFRLDLDRLASSVDPTVRAILVNSPNNPTGAAMTRPELEAVAELCRRHDLWLISDEVYASLLYEGEHLPPAALPGMAERTVTVSSLSKSHAMTGWRVGWLVGPPELARHAVKLSLCMLYGLPAFVQDAATAALPASSPRSPTWASGSADAGTRSAVAWPGCRAWLAAARRVACSSCSTCAAPASAPTPSRAGSSRRSSSRSSPATPSAAPPPATCASA